MKIETIETERILQKGGFAVATKEQPNVIDMPLSKASERSWEHFEMRFCLLAPPEQTRLFDWLQGRDLWPSAVTFTTRWWFYDETVKEYMILNPDAFCSDPLTNFSLEHRTGFYRMMYEKAFGEEPSEWTPRQALVGCGTKGPHNH